jgi:transcriptional regulator GlxA family with amidase domain
MDWALSSLAADLSADAFAKRAAVSSRIFNRAFMDEMTTNPARTTAIRRQLSRRYHR